MVIGLLSIESATKSCLLIANHAIHQLGVCCPLNLQDIKERGRRARVYNIMSSCFHSNSLFSPPMACLVGVQKD